jgi:hypothetical protein
VKRLFERFCWWWEDNGDAAVAALFFTIGFLFFLAMYIQAIMDVE